MENELNETISQLLEYDNKDVIRIKDFFKKSKGSDEKVLQLARTMANKITKVSKAIDRAEAAESILGKDENEIAMIFWSRAKELGADVEIDLKANKAVRKLKDLQIGSVMKGGDKKGGDYRRSPYMKNGSPILPVGKINLTTGKCKYFNVYDTWENSTAEVWEVSPGKYRLVFTAGDGPIFKIGTKAPFAHDQTGKHLFYGEMVDWATTKNLKDLIDIYGNSISGYTYK